MCLLNFPREIFARIAIFWAIFVIFGIFQGGAWCAWWVHILFDHCPLFKGCLFYILVGSPLLYHLYKALCDYIKIGDLAKISFSNPQMKQITKIKVAKVRILFHLWVNNYLFSDLVARYFSLYAIYEKMFFFSCTWTSFVFGVHWVFYRTTVMCYNFVPKKNWSLKWPSIAIHNRPIIIMANFGPSLPDIF